MNDIWGRRLGEVLYRHRVNVVCEVYGCPPAYRETAVGMAEPRREPTSDRDRALHAFRNIRPPRCMSDTAAIAVDPEQWERERDTFRNGTAETVHCNVCSRPVNAWHVVEIRLGFGLGEPTFLCGGCLDVLAEGLYKQCAKNGKPHWRKKPGEAR